VPSISALIAVCCPILVDAGLFLTSPIERRISERYVTAASTRLASVGPTVVGITGSYGKTSTKELVGYLLSQQFNVVASPASYNNRAGLTRTVLESLSDDADVLVAEIGAYRPGEIRDICRWLRPRVGVITAIGPMHLERMGSLDAIVRAKAEILENVEVAVVNIDHHQMESVADAVSAQGTRVILCSAAKSSADVVVLEQGDTLEITLEGRWYHSVYGNPQVHPSNLASALAVGLALGVSAEALLKRTTTLPTPPHRRRISTSPAGVLVIDDTYNSNPAGARSALHLLKRVGGRGRRVVVTPGMVELGREQKIYNEEFAKLAGEIADDVLVVGYTNRSGLRRGLKGTTANVTCVRTRDDAVAWVRANCSAGDAVLYENDLPDVYP